MKSPSAERSAEQISRGKNPPKKQQKNKQTTPLISDPLSSGEEMTAIHLGVPQRSRSRRWRCHSNPQKKTKKTKTQDWLMSHVECKWLRDGFGKVSDTARAHRPLRVGYLWNKRRNYGAMFWPWRGSRKQDKRDWNCCIRALSGHTRNWTNQ